MTNPLLELEQIHVRIAQQTILEDVSLRLHPQEMVTLIGPNGSGKTTLLKIALGLMTPTQGRVLKAPSLRLGYMPQKVVIERTLPLDVLSFLTLTVSSKKAQEVLERLHLTYLRNRSMHVLSGGETQRVLLARALLQDPHVLVLDEPLQGVDPKGQEALYEYLRRYKQETGCAILLVSHDLFFVHQSSDHVICLNKHVCCSGKPEEVKENPDYQALFTHTLPQGLAPYTHHHDHAHDVCAHTSQDACSPSKAPHG